ncbi:polynucleotide adenylyltransferase [Allomyces javanicus]|nr:polynucleotide adenylyltransferase [Allomyces javanicus]
MLTSHLNLRSARSPAAALPAVTLSDFLRLPIRAGQERTWRLLAVMQECGAFESEPNAQKREAILGRINVLVKELVKEVGACLGLAGQFGGTIRTFGSYRLGTHEKPADIDVLCVVPGHVTRDKMLKKEPVLDNVNLIGNDVLWGIDEYDKRSLNGTRITEELLRLVPNTHTFVTTLACIKLWAKGQGVYGKIEGFLSGVAWAILTAHVCQLYPHVAPPTLVAAFFDYYAKCSWSQPITLKPAGTALIQCVPDPNTKTHFMHIMKPIDPPQCAARHLTQPVNYGLTVNAIIAARARMSAISAGGDWGQLF